MKIKHFGLTIFAATMLLFFSSCSKSDTNSTPSPSSNGNTIDITGMSFPSTTVKKGSTVVWNNKDGIAHTVTSDDGTSFDSQTLASGATFSYVANTVGSFSYHCNFHSNMKGTLTVTQ